MSTVKQATKTAPKSKVAAPKVQSEAPAKMTAAERLAEVLVLIDRTTAKPIDPANVKWGKAIALQGGGAVYINHGNADVRLTTGTVQALSKTIKGSTVRGPQGQYLRIAF